MRLPRFCLLALISAPTCVLLVVAGGAADAASTKPTPHRTSTVGTVRPAFTNATIAYSTTWTYRGDTVDVYWGFDYNPSRASKNIRALGILSGSNSRIHVQAQPIRLGDLNGVLDQTTANSQTGYLAAETAKVLVCHPAGTYVSNLYYSIRWPDGTLTDNQSTGRFTDSASHICR